LLIAGLDELQRGKSESNINNPAYSQPLCVALQVALVDLLESFGIVPAAVVGHSSGEIAAAYVNVQSSSWSDGDDPTDKAIQLLRTSHLETGSLEIGVLPRFIGTETQKV
jgi:acyl transferase domain-containing protein